VAEGLTGRETLLTVLTWVITFTFVFFRKRRTVFLLGSLTFILINVGLTALFHPSGSGILLTVGAGVGLYLVIRSHWKKHPYLGRKDMHKLFDKDIES